VGFNLVNLGEKDVQFLEQVQRAMEAYFASDARRISHAHEVHKHAKALLKYIDAEPVLTLTAAYLHDIGIPEAERKYGRCDGKLQEKEGPHVASMLLANIGAESRFVEQICELVANHHTPAGVDSPEFRILWDADALVNLAEVVTGKPQHVVETILDKALVTEAGYRRAKAIYVDQKKNPDSFP